MKRYVVVDGGDTFENLHRARALARVEQKRVYELGPEVKEPDVAPLITWLKAHPRGTVALRRAGCPDAEHFAECGLNLTDALRAAGVVE